MPVCLKCGKEISRGSNFCEECGSLGEKELIELTNTSTGSNFKARYDDHRTLWIVITVAVLMAVFAAFGWGLLTMMPTNARFQAKTEARMCHNNLVRIEEAVDEYYKNTHSQLPAGKLDSKNPLLMDGYLKSVPKCPSTGHLYLLQQQELNPVPLCDSGLAGHNLESE